MDYSGMTVNERLYVSGLLDAFDKARADTDKNAIIEILKKVGLNENSIPEILKALNIS